MSNRYCTSVMEWFSRNDRKYIRRVEDGRFRPIFLIVVNRRRCAMCDGEWINDGYSKETYHTTTVSGFIPDQGYSSGGRSIWSHR